MKSPSLSLLLCPGILRIHRRIDRMRSKSTKVNHAKRKKLQRKMRKLYWKVKENVRNLHWQTVRWMCSRHSVVLMGHLKTSEITKKANRVMGKKATRVMLALSHYQLQQRLLMKAEELGCQARLVNKRLTTKRCSNIHRGIGSNESFWCPNPLCKLAIHRDINAARNMLIMNLSVLKDVLESMRNATA